MLVIVLLASLVTILVLILSTAVHFITILVEESDDDNANAGLGLDSQDFSVTPVISPNDNLVGLDDESQAAAVLNDSYLSALPREQQQQQQQQLQQQHQEQQCNCTLKELGERAIEVPTMSLMSPMLMTDLTPVVPISGSDIINARPEDVQSAELNSRLLKASESQREEMPPVSSTGSLESSQSIASKVAMAADLMTDSMPSPGAWAQKTPDAQRSMIANQLGLPASKQIFDDFDPKEIALGGTALHWCKTRKSLDKLIKLGLPTDIVNRRRETALHVAVRRHKLQVLVGLLIHDANVDCRNENGETPLIVACKVNDIFAAQLLMVFDADYDATDKLGYSGRHYTSAICDRHRCQQQLPSAAHLILAMLNEIGAKRCSATSEATSNDNEARQSANPKAAASSGNKRSVPCTDGCAPSGAYNGNSYNRWPNLDRESLYKRHMFSDIIDAKLRELTTAAAAAARERQGRQAQTQRHYDDRARETPTASRSTSPSRHLKKKSRLLCIDGGGLRGVIVCQIMIEMEKFLKHPMVSYFDWVGGTSVGAFLACALCRGATLKEMRRVCFDVKDEVFSGGRPYNSKFLERVLKRQYGNTTRMSDVKGVKLAVTTVLADREPCQLRLFRNYHSPAQMLETHGYASDTFNNMSGHSIVSTSTSTSTKSDSSSTPTLTISSTNASSVGTSAMLSATRKSQHQHSSAARELSNQSHHHQPHTLATSSTSRRNSLTCSCGQTPPTVVGHHHHQHHHHKQHHQQHACKCNNSTHHQAGRAHQVVDRVANPSQQQQRVSDNAIKCTCCDTCICAQLAARAKQTEQTSVSSTRTTTTTTTTTTTSDSNSDKQRTSASANSSSSTNKDKDHAAEPTTLDESDPDPIIWQAVRASAAAPFFFRPYGPYLDGGLISNNPTLDMLSEFENYQKVRKFLRLHPRPSHRPLSDMQHNVELNADAPSELDLVVSLGTGRGKVISRQTMIDFGQVASGFATVFSPVELVRSIRAARDLFKKLMQQSCHTEDHILDRAQAWCSSLDIPYFRINPPLATIFSIDDKRDEQLVNALWQTKLYMRHMKDQLEELARLLDDGS